MRTRPVGRSGASVTAVGCGDVSLAIAAARGIDSRAVERALHMAIELGLTFVETHDEADAERVAGLVIRHLRARDRVTLATRVSLLAPRPGAPSRDLLGERLPIGYVIDRVESSLRATRLDAIPLVQLVVRPAWRQSSLWPELAGACARLVHDGKVLEWGAIVDGDDGHAELLLEPWLVALQLPFSLCERTAEAVLAAAAAAKVAVLAARPLAGGALAGALGPGVRLPPRDDRHALDAATLERIAAEVARLAAFVKREPVAARSCDAARAVLDRNPRPAQLECATVAELALRFVIDRGPIALPRLHRHEHVVEAFLAAAAPPLSGDLIARLGDATTVR